MGTTQLITVRCPACGRGVRTMRTANVAICICQHRIDAAFAMQIEDEPIPPHIRDRHLVRPQNAWRPLHRYPVLMRERWSPEEAARWYSDWLRIIPTIGCNCDRDWRTATRKDPPDFSSADNFARWAWRQHNGVRKRLGQPRWSWEDCQAAASRVVVGFVAASYMPIGGTETFHRSLLPRLHGLSVERPSQAVHNADDHGLGRPCYGKDDDGLGRPSYDNLLWIDGFCVSGEWDDGDMSLLGVPGCASGVPAARALAARVDVLVTWGVMDLVDILPTPRPRVIAVHHSDASSNWSNETITKNRTLIDRAVCVHPDVTAELLGVPVTCIPNAVDPARYRRMAFTGRPDFRGNDGLEGHPTLRERWGIAPTDRIHFWCHRFAPEKQPDLAIEIARRLPAGHVLVMAGQAFEDVPSDIPGLRYVGPIRSPGDWLATASTFLSLATFEGFGLGVAEAIGAGVPVVSTPVGLAGRPGMAVVTLPADVAAHEWSAALVAAVGRRTPEATRIIHTEYAIDPWVKRWADTILSLNGLPSPFSHTGMRSRLVTLACGAV